MPLPVTSALTSTVPPTGAVPRSVASLTSTAQELSGMAPAETVEPYATSASTAKTMLEVFMALSDPEVSLTSEITRIASTLKIVAPVGIPATVTLGKVRLLPLFVMVVVGWFTLQKS